MFEFENCLRAFAAHILDRVLITDVVRALDCVIHMPAPIVIRVVTCDCAGNTTLGRNSVRTGWKDFGDNGCLVTRLS